VSADDIRATREYRAYMDPSLVWRWRYRATAAEALQACWAMLSKMREGSGVEWAAEARTFLLAARRLLVPEVVPWQEPQRKTSHHYRIELKAWIPHERVVDPVPAPGESHYRGDGHAGYDGSHRVLAWVEFDFDGRKVSGFKGGEHYGTSHRDYRYLWGEGTEEETATGFTGHELRGEGYFHIWISSKNPIPVVPAPAINSEIDGFISCTGLTIVYTTDLFPSHGVQVVRDREVMRKEVIFDASAVPVEGDVGAMSIFVGLTSNENTGSFETEATGDLAACAPARPWPETVPP
jgi:hypothetical protein